MRPTAAQQTPGQTGGTSPIGVTAGEQRQPGGAQIAFPHHPPLPDRLGECQRPHGLKRAKDGERMSRTRKATDWDAMRLQFIIDPDQPDLKQFCGKHDLSYSTASKRSSAEDWVNLRQLHWAKVQTKATDHIADYQSVSAARDTAQQLSHIQAMKMNALKYAGGLEGQEVAYEKPHEAVAAYERLAKLERLILGESTEHIKVDDARAFARDVLAIVREEVSSRDDLERIAARVTALSVGSGTPVRTDRAVH